MDANQSDDAAALVPKTKSKGKAVAADASPGPVASTKSTPLQRARWRKGVAIFDFVLRICASSAAFAASTAAGQAEQVLPFFTQFLQFHAQFDDLPALTFFVAANAVVGGYLVLSLPFSIICILRPQKVGLRLLLVILDTVMTPLIIAAAGTAAAVMYLAHNGSTDANWPAICQQFTTFCQQITGAVVASLVAGVLLISLVALSAFMLKKISP